MATSTSRLSREKIITETYFSLWHPALLTERSHFYTYILFSIRFSIMLFFLSTTHQLFNVSYLFLLICFFLQRLPIFFLLHISMECMVGGSQAQTIEYSAWCSSPTCNKIKIYQFLENRETLPSSSVANTTTAGERLIELSHTTEGISKLDFHWN